MKPHVKILHHTVCFRAERPLVILRDHKDRDEMCGAVVALMREIGLSHVQQRFDQIKAEGFVITFLAGHDHEKVCGLRTDALFIRRSEWTPDEEGTLLLPLIACGRLMAARLDNALLMGGHITEEERSYPYRPSLGHVLIDLDLCI